MPLDSWAASVAGCGTRHGLPVGTGRLPVKSANRYYRSMQNRTEPRTPWQWIRYIVVAIIALCLVGLMLRMYVF